MCLHFYLPPSPFLSRIPVIECDETRSLLAKLHVISDFVLFSSWKFCRHLMGTLNEPLQNGGEPSGSKGRKKLLLFAVISSAAMGIVLLSTTSPRTRRAFLLRKTRVAFVGNSMMYFNDLPRTMEKIGRISQDSILRGGASIGSLVERDNGMWNRWRTDSASISSGVWDLGACTITMLLQGHNSTQARLDYDTYWQDNDGNQSDYRQDNPCLQSRDYLDYLAKSAPRKKPRFDFVVINDNTRNMRYPDMQNTSILKSFYAPLIQDVTPIFLATHAYLDNTTTYETIPYWTVQTYLGYRKYAAIFPNAKVVPVGTAFLVIYEERPSFWPSLFWVDGKHPSPHGSFLQACLLHHAIFGNLPDKALMITNIWENARALMYPRNATVPSPTSTESEYLYNVCGRVSNGYVPTTFQIFQQDNNV